MSLGKFKLFLVVSFLILTSACSTVLAAEPRSTGELRIEMHDYRFEPKVIRLTAGQEVTLVLVNQGDKMHEFMAGREVQIHDGATEAFAQDFFASLQLQVEGPGMVMGMEGMDMGGMDMGESGGMQMEGEEEHTEEESMEMGDSGDMQMEGEEEHTEGESMDKGDSEDMHMEGEEGHAEEETAQDDHEDEGMESMEGMDDAEDEHAEGEGSADDHQDEGADMDMDMGAPMEDEHQEGEGDQHQEGEGDEHMEESAGGGEFGPIQAPLMDDHAGIMVMVDPLSQTPSGEVTRITFTVPEDRVGVWTIGCFQEGGQHFDDGMRGTLIVEAP